MLSQEDKIEIGDANEIKRLVDAAAPLDDTDGSCEKRGSTRFAKYLQLEVTTDPKVPAGSKVVSMHNISTNGLAFWSRKDVPWDSTVFVREFCPEGAVHPWLQARVTHCTVGIKGYLTGVAFV